MIDLDSITLNIRMSFSSSIYRMNTFHKCVCLEKFVHIIIAVLIGLKSKYNNYINENYTRSITLL